MLASLTAFIGHFHPLLVHLPIGILAAALLLQWFARRKQNAAIRSALPLLYGWGALSSLVSALSGYLLSGTDDYDAGILNLHRWMGILLSVCAVVGWKLARRSTLSAPPAWLALLITLLLILTGHFGGSLTHGSAYLLEPLRTSVGTGSDKVLNKPITDPQQALVYADLVEPILQARCYTCHGPEKQKGKLRLDSPDGIRTGGKKGKTVVAGQPAQSEIVRRLLLPPDQEGHMPPKEKAQPTESQIALIQWWISGGADYSKKAGELEQPDHIRSILTSLQQKPSMPIPEILPATAVAAAGAKALLALKERGILVIPVAANTNYLQASFVMHSTVSSDDLEALKAIRDQLIWLRLSNSSVSDSSMPVLASLTQLRRLSLDHTGITDQGLASLKTLTQLNYLNLVGTSITGKGLLALSGLSQLSSLYLYRAKLGAGEWEKLQQAFPKATIDTGGYLVPTLASDTTRLTRKKK